MAISIQSLQRQASNSNLTFPASVLIRQGLSFLTNLLLARTLLPDEYATYVTYYNFSVYIVLAANFGFSEYMLVKSNQQNTIERYLAFFLSLSVSIFTIAFATITMVDSSPLYYLVLTKVFLETIIPELLLPWYQKTANFKKLTTINFAFSVLSTGMLILLFFFEIPLTLFLTGSIIVSIVVTAQQLYNILKKSDVAAIPTGFSLISSDLINYGLNYVTIPVYMRLVPFLVVILLKGKEVAEFNLAFTISSAALILSMSKIKIILPKLIEDSQPFNVALKSISSISAVNLGILILFIISGKPIIHLAFGETYDNLYILTVLLLVANFLQSISGILAAVLVAKKFQKQKLKIQIEVIVTFAIAATLLIMVLGIYGAILAVVLMYIQVIIRTAFTLNNLGFISFSSLRNTKE
ncbi:MAG: hypothetical protein J7619_27085 [Dyadobacter sp.]|uniref:lipopolysaccharide biosynthesis protein n=1 Tax=Dyadobacter sp. TaxID=1914288 RepID=UPI001B022045|nr:hypothetical protein [Dyadobacter sp.]MBO9616384.1 hypothetical protein [Dyadobacter sp.]